LLLDALSGAKLSGGPPYFNTLFIPLMAVLMAATAVGVVARWKYTDGRWMVRMLWPSLMVCLILASGAAVLAPSSPWAVGGVCLLVTFIMAGGLRDIADKCHHLSPRLWLSRGLAAL